MRVRKHVPFEDLSSFLDHIMFSGSYRYKSKRVFELSHTSSNNDHVSSFFCE